MTERNDGEVIEKFNDLNKRLEKFKMHIKSWGLLAVANDSDIYGHKGYVLNNVRDIDVIEGFVKGLEYKKTNS